MKGSGSVLALVMLLGTTAHADVLLLDSITTAPPNSESGLLRPSGGSTMGEVKQRFGEPEGVKDAVGEPPITRWIYPGYTVYFEHDRVIEVVVHR